MPDAEQQRGYFAIGVYHPKAEVNIGTLWRSANIFGASNIFTIGHRYKPQSSDTLHTPSHIPLLHFKEWKDFRVAFNAPIVAIEIAEGSRELRDFSHLEQCIYLLGAEDGGIPPRILEQCQAIIQLPGDICLNVAVAGSIVMYDRVARKAMRNAGDN